MASHLDLLRQRLRIAPVTPAPKAPGMVAANLPPRPERKRHAAPYVPRPTGTGITPHGEFTLRHQAKFVTRPDAVRPRALRTKRIAHPSPLIRIAAHADAPIPNCRHSRPAQRSHHGKA